MSNRAAVTAYPLTDAHRAALLATAADAIGRSLTTGERTVPETPDDPALAQAAATFVTLERDDALLGCIGTLHAVEPLHANVARNAWNAAFADPRLPSVSAAEYAAMSIKVSVLSRLSPMRARSWRDVVRALRPGRDGLLVEVGHARATLLPSVWEKIADREQFLDVLWHKAGLRPRDWLPGTAVHRYTTEEFADAGPRPLVGG